MIRNASDSAPRRPGCVTAVRPVTRKDWIRILAVAACVGLAIAINIRAT